MTELTTRQRLRYYRKAKELINTGATIGICHALEITARLPFMIEPVDVFREFGDFMPDNQYPFGYWFLNNSEGREYRLVVLEFCIAMCEWEIENESQ